MRADKEQSALELMDDPLGLFDHSITKMHTVDKAELAAVQKIAMKKRFEEQYPKIVVLKNLADRLGITGVNEFGDLVPLMFPHTIFKSYSASLLDKKRFDLMTRWLAQLTTYDLSKVDLAGCEGIDDWIERLDEQTALQPITSSGTTGTLSIMPKTKHSGAYAMKVVRDFSFQTFGREPTEEDLNPEVDVIWPNHADGKLGHLRMANMVKTEFTGGDESRFHALYSEAVSTDVMFLASKMRAAASRGELDRLEIDPILLAKKDEFVAMQERRPKEMAEFFEHVTKELAGKRVFMSGAYPILYEVAAAGLDKGLRHVFAPNSVVRTGGGSKGVALPENFMDVIREFLGVEQLDEIYGMSEINAMHWACEHGHYHVQPWVIPFVLDPDSGEELPREGVQTGRAAFFDLCNDSHWGGIISGDEITLDWRGECPCGRSTVFIHHDIMRFSEKQGVDDDRISCAATQDVHDEAVDFMKEL
jgi:hypothetical protein